MNGIETILARIRADSDAETAAIAARSAEDCAAVRTRYEKAADAEYRRVLEAGQKELERQYERSCSTAAMDAKKNLLALKQEMVDAAFARALEQLLALPEEEYISLLGQLAAEAADTGLEEIVLNEADKAGRGRKIAAAANAQCQARGLYGKLTVAEQTRGIRGGLILKTGDIETNCSLEQLVAQQRSALAAQVAGVMFD